MPDEIQRIEPQEGFQSQFLSSPADIVIGGSGAGVGKTYALLMECLRNIHVKKFSAVVFRRTYPQVQSPGGLWDTSMGLFSNIEGSSPSESNYKWKFSSGAKVKFSHLEYEKNILDWQGSQISLICFDELTHFTEKMFFYLLSRNRSTCGVKPYVRATCNPDPDSWVAKFIEWWIDQESGFPIREREGKIRYFIKDVDSYVWGDTKQEVLAKVPHLIKPIMEADPTINVLDLIKSVTFITGSIYQNVELMKKDPGYLANLLSQDEATRSQLLDGNWKIRIEGSDLINYVKMKDAFGNSFVSRGLKCITSDIAFEGSDLFLVGVWDGRRLIDLFHMEKSKGDDVINLLRKVAKDYGIPQSHIVYDDDGIGAFITGFIKNARSFNGGAKARKGQNYTNLKSQCYFKLAERINNDEYYISPEIAKKVIKGKTVEQHIMEERRAIKKHKPDNDGKLSVIPKEQMKNIIGHSPDFMDTLMMREYFEFITLENPSVPISKSAYGLH